MVYAGSTYWTMQSGRILPSTHFQTQLSASTPVQSWRMANWFGEPITVQSCLPRSWFMKLVPKETFFPKYHCKRPFHTYDSPFIEKYSRQSTKGTITELYSKQFHVRTLTNRRFCQKHEILMAIRRIGYRLESPLGTSFYQLYQSSRWRLQTAH